MSKTPYAAKFKDPRWQKKRLEVMQEYGFECRNCGDNDSELHVHHKFYKKKAEPWEYTPDELLVLCDRCHSALHAERDQLNRYVGEITEAQNLERLAGYVCALNGDNPLEESVTWHFLFGYSDYFRTSPEVAKIVIDGNMGATALRLLNRQVVG